MPQEPPHPTRFPSHPITIANMKTKSYAQIMRSLQYVLLASTFTTAACKQNNTALSAGIDKPSLTLKGTKVRVALNRSALGLSTDRPMSRQTSVHNGVEVSISGYVVEDHENFLVLGHLPDSGEHDQGLTWIPHTSILSIYQESQEPGKLQPVDPKPEPWRLEAMHNILGMVSFPLRDLPQGKLTIWWTENGKEDFLNEIEITPGFDRWLCVGVDPVKSMHLFVTVISEEDKGFSSIMLPTEQLAPLQSKVKHGHDWKKAAVIAVEGSGDGKLWAQLKQAP